MSSHRSAVVSLAAAVWLVSACSPPFRSPPYLVQNDTGTVLNGVKIPIRCPGLLPVDSNGTDSEARHDVPVPASLAGPQVGIPGWNDCQRLVQGSGQGVYGPLVGIFANENLGAITPQQFEQPGGMPVAQLYNFSSFRYPILNLQPRYSCLYLRLDSGDWQAHLSWMDSVNACPQLTSWPAGGSDLRVIPSSPTPGAPHPAVARWDWDANRNRNYMAVSCLDAWCEVGAPPLNPSTPPDLVRMAPRKASYDQQTLAVPDNTNKNWPQVRASIAPQPGIDTLIADHLTCSDGCLDDDAGWVQMATVTLEAPATDHYETKMGFTDGANQMHVRRKTRPGQEVWQTRIISARNDTTYLRTLYFAHRSDVPATVRWRWKEDDETSWIRCLPGCCETTDRRIQASDW